MAGVEKAAPRGQEGAGETADHATRRVTKTAGRDTEPAKRRVTNPANADAEPVTRRVSEVEIETTSKRRLSRGHYLGRYLILHELGSGGMSVVYAAYDPELDRKVAIKVLAFDYVDAGWDTESSNPQARLLREAHALAKLSHPNVLPVFDIGTSDGILFMAVEHVEGCTLAEWLKDRPRTWREVLHMFVAAGHGLAAAHRAGLVHRDVKPQNILLGKDGAVRVMDFGLVRRSDDSETPRSAQPTIGDDNAGETRPSSAIQECTDAGLVLGTPMYMAPEQHVGDPIDATADQYSFCVSLYRGLYGQPPFANERETLLDAKMQLRLQPVTSGGRVPRWLHSVVLRGLEPDPARRWPSMTALLGALARDPMRRGLRVAAASIGLGVALAGGWAYGQAQKQRAAICTGGPTLMARAWNPVIHERIKDAFSATALSYAGDTFRTVSQTIDAYASDWTLAHRTACEATHLRGEQSVESLDLRMSCLSVRLRELQAATDVLSTADPGTVKNAVKVLNTFGAIGECDDLERLTSKVPPPSDAQAGPVEDLRNRLAQISAKAAAGKYPEAHDQAEALLPAARTLGYAPLMAEVLRDLGILQRQLGRHELAVETLSEAGWMAEGSRHDTVAASAQMNIGPILAYDLHKFDEALVWTRHTRATLNRLGADDKKEAEYFASLGFLYAGMGDWQKAYDSQHHALTLQIRARGPDDVSVGTLLVNLGAAAGVLNRTEEAVGYYERAIEILKAQLGPQHPHMAAALLNLGQASADLGQIGQAQTLFEQTLVILEAEVGPGHFRVGIARTGLATALVMQGEMEAAHREYQRAVEIQEQSLGPDHPLVPQTILIAANELLNGGKPALAEPFVQHASALVAAHSRDNPNVDAALRLAQGRLDVARGETQRAADEFLEGIAIFEHADDADGALHRGLLYNYATLLSSQGRRAEAIALLERALDLPQPPGLSTARVQFALAKELVAVGGNAARARVLAEDAARAYAKADEAFADDLAKVRRWMKKEP